MFSMVSMKFVAIHCGENKNKISFLDVEIIRDPNKMCDINRFRKKTYSTRFLNFKTHHPLEQNAIIYNSMDKCAKLSDLKFRSEKFFSRGVFIIQIRTYN